MNERLMIEFRLVIGILANMGHTAMSSVLEDVYGYCRAQREIKEKNEDNKETVKENVEAEKLLNRVLCLLPRDSKALNGKAWKELHKDIKTWLKTDENPGDANG